MPDRVSNFAVDEGVQGAYFDTADRVALVGGRRERGDGPSSIAVGFAEVFGDDGFEAEMLD